MNQHRMNQRWVDVVYFAIRRWGTAIRLAFLLVVGGVIYVCVAIALQR